MPLPQKIGGHQAYRNESVGGTVRQISAQPAMLGELDAENTTNAAAYLQIFFLKAADVTLGTTTPDYVIPIEASSRMSRSFPNGLGSRGGAGLSVAGTTTPTGLTAAILKLSAGYV